MTLSSAYIELFIRGKSPGGRACFKKNSSLHIWPKNFSTTFFRMLPKNGTCYPSTILMTFFSHRPFLRFSSLPYFTDYPSFLFLNSTFSRKKFLNDLFYDFSIFCPSVFSYFTDDDSYFFLFAPYTPLLYTHMLFFTFLHLALCSRNS